MADSLLHRLSKIDLFNLIILSIVIVWTFANCRSIILKEEMTQTAKSTIDGLQNIMLMVLGYYLKNKNDKDNTIEIKK